jgi:1,4-dihydroxy-2-naphthoate octaprenyltransferase
MHATPVAQVRPSRLGAFAAELRAPFLTATLATAIVGAFWSGFAGWPIALVVVLGASLMHLSANVFNDWADHKSGADEANVGYVPGLSGGSRLIQKGALTANEVLVFAVALLAAAAACGVFVLATVGSGVLPWAVAGLVLGVGYTVPPLKLVHRGFGEPVIFLAFGPVLAGGAYVATHGGAWPPAGVWAASSVLGLWVALILFANEFPDRAGDAATGKRTWVVRFGAARAAHLYRVLAVASYLLLVVSVATGLLPVGALAGLIAAPLALRNARVLAARVDAPTTELATVSMGTVQAHLLGSLGLLVGIFVS